MFNELDLILRWPYAPGTPVIVDVGAHRGGLTANAGRRGWRVIAFEPEPRNRAILLEAVRTLPNVTVVPKAVSDVAGQTVPFYISPEHHGIHALKPFHETHEPALQVETVRLDETLAEMDIDRVDALKIDIEGADFLAIRSFDFARWQPQIAMCEFMDERSQPNYGYTHHDVAAYMAEQGYTTYVAEWSPIERYVREGEASTHHFIQCAPYPLDHQPAWGNLLFVPREQAATFEHQLVDYRRYLRRERRLQGIKAALKRVPGVYPLYRLLRGRR
ncbi:MAG: FkbM family methyltransferase [Chloroflexota bacterium]